MAGLRHIPCRVVLLLTCLDAAARCGSVALTYTAHPHMDCNQDDAECEPFKSCRDTAGNCIPCCDLATDGKQGCLEKLEAACNSNAVPWNSTLTCVGFGWNPPGNPGLLKQNCYNWVSSRAPNATFYFKPGFGPTAPAAPRLFVATSEHIRVVGRTARSSAASTSLHFDWPATTIVAKMTGPASVVLKESSNASQPPNPRHGPPDVANSYWISTHPPCCDWDSSACKPSLSYADLGGKCVEAHGVRLNTTATATDYPLGLQAGETATVRIEKITEAREDMGGVVEFVGRYPCRHTHSHFNRELLSHATRLIGVWIPHVQGCVRLSYILLRQRSMLRPPNG